MKLSNYLMSLYIDQKVINEDEIDSLVQKALLLEQVEVKNQKLDEENSELRWATDRTRWGQ
jgi:hypothetical protein